MEMERMVDVEDGMMWSDDVVKHTSDVVCTDGLI